MKKPITLFVSLLIIVGAIWIIKKRSEPKMENKSSLFTSFEASLNFKMKSVAEINSGDGALAINTLLSGDPEISFYKKERLMKVKWTPVAVFEVNKIVKTEYAQEFNSVVDETFYVHFDKQMVVDGIYYSLRSSLSPEVQDLILNFNKMLTHQLTWYFILAPKETVTIVSGVDIWSENNQEVKNDNTKILVDTKSVEKGSNSQQGTGHFEVTRGSDGKVSSVGNQHSVLGDPAKPMAKTENNYETKTVFYRESQDLKIDIDLARLMKTPPWIVADPKALRAATLREKLKDWNPQKLREAVFGFKVKKNAPYKDIAELSALLDDMLFMNNSLAKDYYEWALKLGSKHPLYDEIIKSLGFVGCPECQKYLVKITNDFKGDKEASQKALIAIGFLQNPLEESEEGLRELAEEKTFVNHELADYMLGTMASKMEENEPDRALRIDKDYSERIRKNPGSIPDIRHNLTVLGNSGLCSEYDQIIKLISHPDESVQKDALLATRFCKNEALVKVYWGLFKTKANLHETLFQALDMRLQKGIAEQALFDNFKKWLLDDSAKADDHLKKTVVGYLKSFGARGPSFNDQFKALAASCADYKLCYYFN